MSTGGAVLKLAAQFVTGAAGGSWLVEAFLGPNIATAVLSAAAFILIAYVIGYDSRREAP